MSNLKHKIKDNRIFAYGGTGILAILAIIWAGLKNIEIALSLLQYITIDQTGNNTMVILDILLILILTGIILGLIHFWYKSRDKRIKEEHFIEVLKKLHQHQCRMSRFVEGGSKEAVNKEARDIGDLLKDLEDHKSFDVVDKIKARNLLGNESNRSN